MKKRTCEGRRLGYRSVVRCTREASEVVITVSLHSEVRRYCCDSDECFMSVTAPTRPQLQAQTHDRTA